jgi:hypothetical protein
LDDRFRFRVLGAPLKKRSAKKRPPEKRAPRNSRAFENPMPKNSAASVRAEEISKTDCPRIS